MKINTIYHPPEEYIKERKKDISKSKFSKNPDHHPFIKERELVRAINASKIGRLFAKPFVASLSHHKEGINNMVTHPLKDMILTSSFDDNIILTDIVSRTEVVNLEYKNKVKGIGIDNLDNIYVCNNKQVLRLNDDKMFKNESSVNNICLNIDLFVSTYNSLEIFDTEMGCLKNTIKIENSEKISRNPVFTNLLGFTCNNSVFISDLRLNKTVIEFCLENKTNGLSFSPSDGYFISLANEDANGYIYDLRYNHKPANTLRGHVSAVTCIKYNPQGTEICTGSFDQSIRIFKIDERKSRDIYYNKRMHNITGLEYSKDGQFIISGSDDGSIRIWKAEASKKLGALTKKEKDVMNYSKVLIDKYKNVQEVDRINKHRFVPKLLKNKMKQQHEHHEAEIRKGRYK
ncbi:ddb1- and cul4-associated factor 13-like protein [Vairimorpha apis BRL 01]|uniref:Ddb1-and cul4-associated factor 13-like protein n=1 Tax=Vairimorpha apis BRL 01 TaxID=1037528 RepID=T0M8U6_9MICR|nr:ddb1- and cul4-associated factor 13-like protein [Vairimorpha apis BRL 01]